jgi:undecaprenyl-diphosphatase
MFELGNTIGNIINGIRNMLMLIAQWDMAVLTFFNATRTPILDTFFWLITWLGSMWVLLPLSLLIAASLALRQQLSEWRNTLYLPITLGLASLTTWLLKPVFERDRPQLFEALMTLPPDMSFPSGHATQASAFFLALWLMLPKHLRPWLIAPALVMIILVAVSRPYLQVHWFSDVLVGCVIGCGYAIGLWFLLGKKEIK